MLGMVLASVVGSAVMAQFQPRVVFVSGDTDPGEPGVALVSLLRPEHAINNRGEVVFHARRTDGSRAILHRDGVSEALGTTPGFGFGPGGWYGVNISDSGDSLFGVAPRYSLWRGGEAGAVQILAPGTLIAGSPMQSLTQGGVSLFGPMVNGGLVATTLEFPVTAFSSRTRGVVGNANGWSAAGVEGVFLTALTTDGWSMGVAFDVPTNSSSLVVTRFGQPSQVVLASGSTLEGLPAGTTVEYIDPYGSMRTGGEGVFGVSLVGPGVTISNRVALCSLKDGAVSLLVREGDVLTDVAGSPMIVQLPVVLWGSGTCSGITSVPIITESGIVAMPLVLQYGGESFTRTAVLLIHPSGRRQVVLRAGDPLPDGTTIGPLANQRAEWSTFAYAVNRHGQVATLDSADGFPCSFDRLLITDAQGRPTIVTREFDPIVIRSTTYDGFQFPFLWVPPVTSGGGDGRPRIFNDRGEFAFWVIAYGAGLDAADALVVAQVPPGCDAVDFNNDGGLFDPTDIDAFLSVFSEGPCLPAGAACNDVDFNNDGSLFDPCDIDSFLLLFSEGPCTPCGL